MSNSLFKSTVQFKQHFIQQLQQMITLEEFGVFILVMANAISRAEIHQQLKTQLSRHYLRLNQKLEANSTSQRAQIAADDLSVFQQLGEIALEELPLARVKISGAWQLQYNPLRGFRPARKSHEKINKIHQPFDPGCFHFNKPFLIKEMLWNGELADTRFTLLYNKFPFADYHGLLAIEPEKQKPQFLNHHDILLTQALLEEISNLEGLGLAYNSLGAYASVNHQHWQLFLSEQDYPVEHAQFKHNGGTVNYPLTVECFHNLMEAWPQIDYYQQLNNSFNLFVRPHRTYLVNRKKQGEYQHSDWTTGFAWSEIMGNIMTTRPQDFQRLSSKNIEQEFTLLKL